MKIQKQPSRGVLKKRYSQNMQNYGMPKCDFRSNFIEIALWHGCSPVNLLHIFKAPLPNNTSGRLLLKIAAQAIWAAQAFGAGDLFRIFLQKQSARGVLLKDVLRNFAKFTGKHLCQSLFFK